MELNLLRKMYIPCTHFRISSIKKSEVAKNNDKYRKLITDQPCCLKYVKYANLYQTGGVSWELRHHKTRHTPRRAGQSCAAVTGAQPLQEGRVCRADSEKAGPAALYCW